MLRSRTRRKKENFWNIFIYLLSLQFFSYFIKLSLKLLRSINVWKLKDKKEMGQEKQWSTMKNNKIMREFSISRFMMDSNQKYEKLLFWSIGKLFICSVKLLWKISLKWKTKPRKSHILPTTLNILYVCFQRSKEE